MRIFLSYASEQRSEAERLNLSLVQDEHDVFFDRSTLKGGEAYDRHIREALWQSDLLIFLISPESVASGYALSELLIYSERFPNPAGRVLPVIVAETEPSSIPGYLNAVNYIKPIGSMVAEVAARVGELAAARRKSRFLRVALFAGFLLLAVAAALLIPKLMTPRRSTPTPILASEPPQIEQQTALKGFSVFAEQNQDSRIIYRARAGTKYTLLASKRNANWARVRLAGGMEGWAMTQDLSSVASIGIAQGFGYRGSFWQLFFTSPRPEDNQQDEYGIEVRFARAIDNCKRSLDIASYDLDNHIVTDAILDAHRRGVLVRVVTDDRSLEDENNTFQELKKNGVPVVTDGNKSRLMHNTFTVLDGKLVWAGSWNYTNTGTYKNNENAIVLESEEIAAVYEEKFNQMFREFSQLQSGGAMAAFSLESSPIVLPHGVKVYFGPENDAQGVLQSLLQDAKSSIRFMQFALTLEEVAAILVGKARSGLKVQGILEERLTKYSSASGSLLDSGVSGIEVRIDGNRRFLRHNCLIIDDELVVTGSFNFSRASTTRNYENMVVVPDPALAGKYREEFERLWTIAKDPKEVSNHR